MTGKIAGRDLVGEFVYGAFKSAGAILEGGHFVYASGRHGSVYVAHEALYADTEILSRMCAVLAVWAMAVGLCGKIDTVFGPATGGIPLSQWTAHHLSSLCGKRIASVWADKLPKDRKKKSRFEIPQDFWKHVEGRNVFLVDDIVTTAGTLNTITELVYDCGGTVVGIGALWNRGTAHAGDFGGKKFLPLLTRRFDDWSPEDCSLCKAGVPINTRFGHGKGARFSGRG